jgi:hypothetical protein
MVFEIQNAGPPAITSKVYDNFFRLASIAHFSMKNCVDITNNRTQYLVVVTLLPLEMGSGFEFRPVRRTTREKNSPGGISCQQRKRQRKRKRNINQERGSFSLKKFHRPLGRSTFRGVFYCPDRWFGKIWVVPEAGWW